MSREANLRFQAVLDPLDRSSEVLFGPIMALTFTTTFEVATAGRTSVRTMLIGALGCNLAWGIVDGVMAPPRLTAGDLCAGAAVCILVFLSTFPVALPFLLFRNLPLAARVSAATALVMLFVIGTSLGRHAGRRRPPLVGLTMVALGAALSAIALGG